MLIFACCDENYFLDHGKAFCASATKINKKCLIKILNPTNKTFNLISELDKKHSFIFESNVKNSKPLFASKRFLDAPAILIEKNDSLLICDIDSYFLSSFNEPSSDIGLFLREDELFYGMKIFAGVVYYSTNEKSLAFSKTVRDKILSLPLEWYIDQIALYEVYKSSLNTLDIHIFDKTFCSWDFNEEVPVWAGKGNRKFSSEKYLQKKKNFEV